MTDESVASPGGEIAQDVSEARGSGLTGLSTVACANKGATGTAAETGCSETAGVDTAW